MEELAATPLTVVGAGPAGIMAAWAAAEAGAAVTVVDDHPLPGGQSFGQPPPQFSIAGHTAAPAGHPAAAAYVARLEHPRIRTLFNTVAWGVFDERVLALADHERTYALAVDRVILATGAYDRPLAFPGWTLPGIQGAGATLRMLKTQWLRPGRRVLLAGLGPLQFALAHALLEAGVQVVCIAEASNPWAAWRALPGLWGHWERLREALAYVQTLRRRRVPYLVRHAIIAAGGDGQVEHATLARLDAAGAPIPGSERRFDVDTVCLGYGLLPSFQLAAAFGCTLSFVPHLRWWAPCHDEQMQTTEPGIFVAGDMTDIAGAEVAALQGQVAGLTAAHQLAQLDAANLASRLASSRAALRRLKRLSAALNRIYAMPDGLAFLARADTWMCRCEEVSLEQVRQAVALGGTDLHQLKLRTRAGMGYCQGRNCSALLAPIIARETGQPLSALRPFTVRPPLQPIPLDVLAGGASAPVPD